MTDNNFKISKVNGTIIIEKDNQVLAISQSSDDDIWFNSSKKRLSLEINISSRNHSEWQTHMVFESLMKSIIGKYILNGDNKNEHSRLPEDFVNLDRKIISWHSDNGIDNILSLSYNERNITISISNSKEFLSQDNNAIRIRTSGSRYGDYYQEFLDFFRSLKELECRLNKTAESMETKEVSTQKKLSLFGKNKKC